MAKIRRICLYSTVVVLAGVIFTGIALSGTKGIEILFPQKGDILVEGQSYRISWQTGYPGMLCIEGAIGGKDKGILNDCQTWAQQGYWDWNIPAGFVSDFGIEGTERARINIFFKNRPGISAKSPPFTIISQRCFNLCNTFLTLTPHVERYMVPLFYRFMCLKSH